MKSKQMFDNIFIVIEELHNQCICNLSPYTNNLNNISTSRCNIQTTDKVLSLSTCIKIIIRRIISNIVSAKMINVKKLHRSKI